MNLKINFLGIALLVILFTCNTKNKPSLSSNKEGNTTSVDSLTYEEIRGNLRGASFSDTIRITKYLSFSNQNTKDRFELLIFPGPISKSSSTFTIKGEDKNLIYADTFLTDFFTYHIFEPDTVPTSVSQEEYDQYMLTYARSLSKKKFEEFTLKNANNFFDEIFADKKSLKELIDNEVGQITDSTLYSETIANNFRKIIYVPCFDCDEGGYYVAYSLKEKKAKSILASD